MDNNLKILQIVDSLNSGGTERMSINIFNMLNEKGITNKLFVTRRTGLLEESLVNKNNYVIFNKKHFLDLITFFKVYRSIRLFNPNIIHAHQTSIYWAIFFKFFLFRRDIKIIWHNHYGNSENLPLLNKILLIGISNIFNSTISVNLKLKEWAVSTLKSKNNYYLPNFASLNTKIKKTTFLKGKNNARIICLANLRPEKDHINLLKAFKKVQKTYPDWTLHLIGLDLKDSYSAKIKSFIAENKLVNTVFLYGARQDIAFILKQSTIGVLASKSEGLPVALLEYGLAKLPVVVTNVGDCVNVVTNEISGLVVAPNSDKQLAEAILKLIDEPNLSKIFGEELFKTVTSKFSKEKYISKLIKIYH